MGLRVGVGLFTGQLPVAANHGFNDEYRGMIDLVRLADDLSFDSVWFSEHHGSSDGYCPSLLPMLAACSSVTSRVRLGTSLLLAPLHDPLRLAEDAAVVDQLSSGRLILGLGLGWRPEEFRAFSRSISSRAAALEEIIQILRQAWTGERFSWQGRVYQYEEVLVTPPAAGASIPIFLGGMDPRAIERAGRMADGYIHDRSEPSSWECDFRLAKRAFLNSGRDDGFTFVQLLHAFPHEDGDAWSLIRDAALYQAGVYQAWARGADTPGQGLEVAGVDEVEVRENNFTGQPDDVVEWIKGPVLPLLREFDILLVMRFHYPGMDFSISTRAMELFAAEVLPSLQAASVLEQEDG
jgi:alkanesulfonate monooxygenase SsuD/methylene tetrahydromethanopterin reductase-like flavin-dependent oxidoreductase (luciferase family)